MQRAASIARPRAFSQQALRRLEEASNGRRVSTVKPLISKFLDLHGQSYLVPTLTLTKDGKEKQHLFPIRAKNRLVPVILDLHQVSSDGSPHSQSIKRQELRNQVVYLQEAGYMPVGISNASEDVKKLAADLKLPYFIGTRLQLEQQKAGSVAVEAGGVEQAIPVTLDSATAFVEKEMAVSIQTTAEPLSPMVVTHSVRSGQQIYAQNRSLVVLGNVSSGAEVMADEDVVVLGVLKGRALAGIGGNVRARIVCQSFDAELISIAHCFTTCDELEQDDIGPFPLHKPTAISLQDDRLFFESSTV